jgi:chitin-binding protein
MWSPQAARDGLGAFEGVEDDRAGSDPGVKHIYVQGDDYRFDMPLALRDTSPDRQRNEVKGMHADGRDLALGLGETWRLDWSLYIPSSLQATNRFTHIMQLKMPGTGSAPILTMSLQRQGDVPRIQVKIFDSSIVIGAANLAPLQNRWLTSSLTFTIGNAPQGAVSWTLRADGATVVNSTRTGLDTWLDDRVRPKWGIYRSVLDTSGSLHDCYLLITNLRAYRHA